MRRFLLTATILMALAATPWALAQEQPALERILVPVLYPPTAGAFDSLWTTELAIRNNGNEIAFFTPIFCGGVCGGVTTLDPGASGFIKPLLSADGFRGGAFLYVDRKHASDISLALRAQDLSRQAETWGTEIPLVRESELRSGTTVLLNVPLDTRFRQTLRLYHGEATAVPMRVRLLSASNEVIAETIVNVPAATGQFIPGYAEIGAFRSAFPTVGNDAAIHVEVRPLIDVRYWAFITITNNATQHVTTVTPQ
ncbi:MAG TPA: hypothetical protein VFN10_20655 [Thermoanaerobaculia bacterium]|nr:hypothetical protein [Thermoanaerobaculia bacterium]